MRGPFALAGLWALVACPGPGPELPAPGAPDLRVAIVDGRGSATTIDFGDVEVGDSSSVALELRNEGTTALRSLLVELPPSRPELSLPVPAPRFLEAGESFTVRLLYAPSEDASLDDVLSIRSDDPGAREVSLRMLGEGLGVRAALTVASSPPPVPVGCRDLAVLRLSHEGRGGEVVLEDLGVQGEDLGAFVPRAPERTLTLGPGEFADVEVEFAPLRPGAHSVVVRADGDPGSEALLEAEATLQATVSDRFVQSEGAQADLLFVVDSSPGMEHDALLAAAPALVTALSGHALNWHVGVITADINDLGALRGPPAWVHAAHQEPVDAIRDAWSVGTEGGALEQGLHSAFLSLSDPMIGGANAGFVRDDALLHVVFVSDDEDRSEPATGWTAADYAAFFAGRKEVALDVVASDITGGRQGCSDARTATDGDRYVDVTEALGGSSHLYCDADWGLAMEAIADASRKRRRRFVLTEPAVPNTVEVAVGGVEATGWTHDTDADAVVFDPSTAPAPGAEVVVSYAPRACPEG